MKIEEKIARFLIQKKKTLSVAESCTGGLVSHRLTNITGSSQFLKAAIVVYSNESKIKFLKVSFQTLKKYGAVSQQTALQMVKGIRKSLKTDYAVAITGIAGPSGGTKAKPVGLVFIAASSAKKTVVMKKTFQGNRLRIKSSAASAALHLLSKLF
ncbi:MAG: CinA family protein [Candidatus Omnitrophota bacterium]